MFSVLYFFENLTVYEIMWKNAVQRGRPRITIQRMRIACWIPRTTNTNTDCVTLIAFPLQQLLHECHLMLRYIYTACLVLFFAVALRPNAGHGLLIHVVSRSHTTTHHSRQDSSGRVISSLQRPLRDNRQTSMPPVGFESTISEGERPQTYALYRAATGTGCLVLQIVKYKINLIQLNIQSVPRSKHTPSLLQKSFS